MAAYPSLAAQRGPNMAGGHVEEVALGTSEDQAIWKNSLGVNVRITKATFVPDAAHTGADTNHMTLGIVNKELLGVGTVVVAPQKLYASGVDLVAYKPEDLPLSATAADLVIADGEVVAFSKAEVGSGLASPAGTVELQMDMIGDGTV